VLVDTLHDESLSRRSVEVHHPVADLDVTALLIERDASHVAKLEGLLVFLQPQSDVPPHARASALRRCETRTDVPLMRCEPQRCEPTSLRCATPLASHSGHENVPSTLLGTRSAVRMVPFGGSGTSSRVA